MSGAPILPIVNVVKATSSGTAQGIGAFVKNLFKNKGVQVGAGLTATAGGLFALSESSKSAVAPLGIPQLSPILLIGIVAIIFILMLGMKR